MTDTQTQSLPFRRALPWLLFITGMFYVNFTARTIFSPLMVSIEHDLGINHYRAGSLFLLLSSGYGVTLLLSGYITSRISHRTTIALMPILMGIFLILLGFSESFGFMRFIMFFFGMAAGIYLPSGIASVTSITAPKDWGKALSVHELAPNTSFVLSPLIAEAFLLFTTWRGALIGLGIFAILAGLLFLRFGKAAELKSDPPNFGTAKRIVPTKEFWVLALLFTLIIGSSFGIYSVLPLFLVDERGLDPTRANQLLALSRITGPGVAFIAGYLSDRLGTRRALLLFTTLTALATGLLGILRGPYLIAVLLVQPPLTVCFFPPAFATLSGVFGPKIRSVAVSFITPFGIFAGGGLTPTLLGRLGDNGMFWIGFVVLGIILAASLYPISRLEERGPIREQDLDNTE